MAASEGAVDVVKYLIENHPEVVDCKAALHSAAHYNHIDIVKYLVEKGIDIKEDPTPIHSAAVRGHFELVDYLIENGAHVDLNSEDLCTPLHSAKNFYTVKILVKHGEDVNALDDKGRPPLFYNIEDSVKRSNL